MFNLTFRTSTRPARQESTEQHRPERPLPRVFVRKLECDLKQQDKLARLLVGRRPE
jgi:hypothetical protein